MFCDEFILSDLRLFENCQKVLKGCDHCFNLAADMGGMGFIQSNHSVIFYNNVGAGAGGGGRACGGHQAHLVRFERVHIPRE